MRARHHPWALFGLWAWQATLALLVSGPAAALVRVAYGSHPRGDASLWEAGGNVLLDFLFRNPGGLAAVARDAEMVLVGSAVAGLLPTAAAMFALAKAPSDRPAAGFVACVSASLAAFPRLATLLVLVGTAQALLLAVGAATAMFCEKSLHAAAGEARAEQWEVAVAFVFLFAVSVFGVVHDLARASLVHFGVGALRALAIGVRVFGGSPAASWWAWGWRALVSMGPILVIASVTKDFGAGSGAVLSMLVMHQGAVAARIAFRASWLAKALRTASAATPYDFGHRAESER